MADSDLPMFHVKRDSDQELNPKTREALERAAKAASKAWRSRKRMAAAREKIDQ